VRLLILCGSWQPGSANRSLSDIVARRAIAAGHEVDRFDALPDIAPFDPVHVDEPAAPVALLRSQLEVADGVLIAAPEYAGALAGVVKNALDWMVGSGSLWDKPVGIASAGTTGGSFARRDLAQTLAWQGALVVSHLGIAAPRTKSDAAGNLTDAATVAEIERFTDELLIAAIEPRSARIRRARGIADEFGLDPMRVAGGATD
jgi:NAD(P)H-dependent FMN reductase